MRSSHNDESDDDEEELEVPASPACAEEEVKVKEEEEEAEDDAAAAAAADVNEKEGDDGDDDEAEKDDDEEEDEEETEEQRERRWAHWELHGGGGQERANANEPVQPHYKPDSWGFNVVQVLRDAAPAGLTPTEIVLAIAQTGRKFGVYGTDAALASVRLRSLARRNSCCFIYWQTGFQGWSLGVQNKWLNIMSGVAMPTHTLSKQTAHSLTEYGL
jgi:hypothetical protein